MSGRVVSFFKRTVSRDWSSQELAEFYRVEAAMLPSGLRVTPERGVTDEGDPWFIFCRAEDDEVIVHFARIEGRYLISAPSFGGNVSGYDFSTLVRDMVARNPVLRPARRDENVTFHPSALLVVLVASALLKMNHAAEAATVERPAGTPTPDPDAAPLRITIAGVEHIADLVSLETQQYAALLSAIALASGSSENLAMPVFVVTAPAPEPAQTQHESSAHHALAMDWSASGGGSGGDGGGGSVTPAPQTPAPASAPDGSTHVHDLAAAQMQPASLGGGVAPSADLVVASLASVPTTPPPMAPADDAAAAPGGNGPGVIQANHDLASSLLQAVGGNEPIMYTQTLPAAFVAPLHDGTHTSAATLVADSHDAATTVAAALPPSAPATEAVTPVFIPGGAGFDATPSAGVDTSFGAAPSSSLVPVPTAGAASEFAAVQTIMQNFAQMVGSHLAILVSGNQVIEYDYFAVDYTPAAVSAVTYDFPDGSHVSLVGLRSELPHTTV